jgi:hypothetical protein
MPVIGLLFILGNPAIEVLEWLTVIAQMGHCFAERNSSNAAGAAVFDSPSKVIVSI